MSRRSFRFLVFLLFLLIVQRAFFISPPQTSKQEYRLQNQQTISCTKDNNIIMNRIIPSSICSSTGFSIPSLGLGTMLLDNIPQSIHSAISLGYRRFDCAPVYFNEDRIGDALANEISLGNVKREELYLVSKLPSPFHRREHVELAIRKSLNDLRVDYLDLYLIHWPTAFKFVPIDPTKRGYENEDIDDSNNGKNIDPNVSVEETWSAMEELVEKGLVKEIGVSNFPVSLLHELLARCKIKPSVNQVELHPYLQQNNLIKYCQKRGIHTQGYSPIGSPGYAEAGEPEILKDPILNEIATSRGISVAQVCLLWGLQRGNGNISLNIKSSSTERQKENLEILDGVMLTENELERIASLERGYRYFRPEDWWGDMAMAVFD